MATSEQNGSPQEKTHAASGAVPTREARRSHPDRTSRRGGLLGALVLTAGTVFIATVPATAGCQTTSDPFPTPIEAEEGVVVVDVSEFAEVPDHEEGPARMMRMVDEPGTGRMFVNDMRGPLYTVSYDGESVDLYLDISDPEWGVGVEAGGRERGVQSFAFHPDFGRSGTAGYGKFYTWSDTPDTGPAADFRPGEGNNTHHTVLLEWTAENPRADTYDGGPPRQLMRFEQPYGNHNAGHLSFHPFAAPGDPEFGLLYIGSADGGSGGDPLDLAQDLSSAFGKILRIDPLGSNSENGEYGIPADNPYAEDGDPQTRDEIYAVGLRNPQRFGWDPTTGTLYVADIGQNTVEEVSPAPRGANLGWNEWEGSYRYEGRSGVSLDDPRSDPEMVYPVVEYDREDPLIGSRAAATGVHVFRTETLPQLRDRVLFGDFPSGEIFHFDADDPPGGGNRGFRRVLLRHDGDPKTFLELIQEKNEQQGRSPASRADLRFGTGPDGRFFLLNKHDGTIREVEPRR